MRVVEGRIAHLSEPQRPHIALHAYELRLPHPRTGKLLEFRAPIPEDMARAWEALGGNWPE